MEQDLERRGKDSFFCTGFFFPLAASHVRKRANDMSHINPALHKSGVVVEDIKPSNLAEVEALA